MRDAHRPAHECMSSTGELIDIESVTISMEEGRWKSSHGGDSLAAYPTASPVLHGGDEETGLVRPCLVATQLQCAIPAGGDQVTRCGRHRGIVCCPHNGPGREHLWTS